MATNYENCVGRFTCDDQVGKCGKQQFDNITCGSTYSCDCDGQVVKINCSECDKTSDAGCNLSDKGGGCTCNAACHSHGCCTVACDSHAWLCQKQDFATCPCEKSADVPPCSCHGLTRYTCPCQYPSYGCNCYSGCDWPDEPYCSCDIGCNQPYTPPKICPCDIQTDKPYVPPPCSCHAGTYICPDVPTPGCSCDTSRNSTMTKCSCDQGCYQEPRACTCNNKCYQFQACQTCDGCDSYRPCICDIGCDAENCAQCHKAGYSQPW